MEFFDRMDGVLRPHAIRSFFVRLDSSCRLKSLGSGLDSYKEAGVRPWVGEFLRVVRLLGVAVASLLRRTMGE